jgi:hypothetical protein
VEVEVAGPALALAGRDGPAHEAVAVGRDPGIGQVAEQPDPRQVIGQGRGPEDRPRRHGPRRGLDAREDAAVGGHQVHGLHAGVVGDAGEAVEGPRVLEADRDDGAGARQPQQAADLNRAEAALAVVEQDVPAGGRGPVRGDRR